MASAPVKYLDLQSQFQDPCLWDVVRSELESTQFILGPKVETFEENFADYCQCEYAIGVNSGTDALFIALKAVGVGVGDEVITVPNSFIATAGAIVATGARPLFVDVAMDYNMDVSLIEAAITPRTKAILPVHLTGNPSDMPAIMAIAKKHGLSVIEDAAQSVGASINDQRVGAFGDMGCFSLHPLKNLNGCGDGGMITTNSKSLCEEVKLLRNHGLKNRDEIACFGFNSRLDSIQAAVANYTLSKLESIISKRIKLATLYDSLLKGASEYITIPSRLPHVRQVYHTYVIRVKNRSGLIAYLTNHQIETKIHYPIPIHLQGPALQFGHVRGDFPECEVQAKEIISLPIHQQLSEEDVSYIATTIRGFYGL